MPRLPFVDYPGASDLQAHGLLPLPRRLPPLNDEGGLPFRSAQYRAVSTESFPLQRLVELARMIGASFAVNEPMVRHLRLPLHPPDILRGITHTDPFGSEPFGEWTKDNVMHWVVRLIAFTRGLCADARELADNDFRKLSTAILDADGQIIGGAISFRFVPDPGPALVDDVFMQGVLHLVQPILDLLMDQESSSLENLSKTFPDFGNAHETGRVAELFMIARSPSLPSEDTFELVAGTIERMRELGCRYVVTAGANQWTGAAFELLGATRVHFAPFRDRPRVLACPTAHPHLVSSSDGFLSAKDSGSMFYAARLS
jgi:hypothetical protein